MRHPRKWIEQELRARIQRGDYPPGSRMPTHRSLQAELGASSATLQRAFDRLTEQGFVKPQGVQGTFVSAALPHVSSIALVIPEVVGVGAWNRFWSIGKRVAEEWDDGTYTFHCYHLAGHSVESEGYAQLRRDVADGGIAGLVFLSSPFFLKGSELLAADIPRVVIPGRAADCATYRGSVIAIGPGTVLETVMARFAADGRRRLAAITGRNQGRLWLDRCTPLMREHGIATRPEWWIGLPVTTEVAECSRAVAQLLFAMPERHRPDALLITDDNHVPHATAGMLDAQPDGALDATVVAHANFPGATRAVFPSLRYGPDMAAMMGAAVDEIARLRRGERPRLVEVPQVVRER